MSFLIGSMLTTTICSMEFAETSRPARISLEQIVILCFVATRRGRA
jgi:hypothetical protein